MWPWLAGYRALVEGGVGIEPTMFTPWEQLYRLPQHNQ